METYLSRIHATLLADPECQKLDWFDIALRRLGGITKAAKLIRVSASRLKHYRERGLSSLTSDQIMNIAQSLGRADVEPDSAVQPRAIRTQERRARRSHRC